MAFDSFTFLLFFGTVWTLDRLAGSWRLRKLWLLLASWVFYAAWSPPFVVLLWVSTLVDWLVGRGLVATSSVTGRRLFLTASLATNPGCSAISSTPTS